MPFNLDQEEAIAARRVGSIQSRTTEHHKEWHAQHHQIGSRWVPRPIIMQTTCKNCK